MILIFISIEYSNCEQHNSESSQIYDDYFFIGSNSRKRPTISFDVYFPITFFDRIFDLKLN